MKLHLDAVFNTVLNDTCEAITYITSSISFDPETVQLQMEEISQEIQDVTSDCLVKIPIPNRNLLDTYHETINYIEAFLQDHHSYTGPPSTTISRLCSPDALKYITPGIRAETYSTTAVTSTASVPNGIITATMSTLYPESPL